MYRTYQLLQSACHPELEAELKHAGSRRQSCSARPACKPCRSVINVRKSGTCPQVEDLLEYYMQRAATLQSESERLLAGARDLEESVGVSLSARRFEVQHTTNMQQALWC